MSRASVFLPLVVLSGIIIGCGAGDKSTGPPVPGAPVASVSVEPATASVVVGGSIALTATLKDGSGSVLTGRGVAWASDNVALATVSAAGVVSGVLPGGPVTVTATSEGKSGGAQITVLPAPVASVTITPADTSIMPGAVFPLTATVRDAHGAALTDRRVSWSSDDVRRATVSATGVVTAQAASGLVVVTASSEGVSGTSRITVRAVDPSMGVTLVQNAIGAFECAYNNYVLAGAVHSDEMEGVRGDAATVAWSHRSVTPALAEYVSGPCETEGGHTPGGLHLPMQTARSLPEFAFALLAGWTDADIPNRAHLMAVSRAYAGYAYLFFGESYCAISFDQGPQLPPTTSLQIAEQRFTEAISLAVQAGSSDVLNLAMVGMARVKMDLKKWSEAAQFARQVPVGYLKHAARGTEGERRYNKIFAAVNQGAAFTVAPPYRTMADPRVPVVQTGQAPPPSNAALWVTTKYQGLGSPIRLASYEEAKLIDAEAQAQMGQVAAAEQIVNDARARHGLPALSFTNVADALAKIIEERRRELSFEGGHRLNDLLRYAIPWKSGVSPVDGLPYGDTTCWPFPGA